MVVIKKMNKNKIKIIKQGDMGTVYHHKFSITSNRCYKWPNTSVGETKRRVFGGFSESITRR